MEEKYLTLDQNICAARIFLNTFGFILEDVNELDEFSKIKIYNKSMNIVGQLYFNKGKVMFSAKYKKSTLTANYDIAKVFGFVDIECDNALFGKWSSNINFQIQNDQNTNINGEFLIENNIDSQFGISCLCHPLINYQIPNKGNITIKILRDGLIFGLEIISENYNEKIHIRPSDDLSVFLLHDIKCGEYNSEKHGYPYRKYAGIFNGTNCGENKDKLHIFLTEEEYDKNLCYHDEYVPKIDNDNSSESLIQKGLLMQKLDNSLIEKVNELQKIMLIDDISLLDNLISVCYDSYTDEELNALLGIKKENIFYQNGAKNLTDSYFGMENESKLLSLKQRKQL